MLEIPSDSDYLNCGGTESVSGTGVNQDDLYSDAAETYGPALHRLARAYEADPETRRDRSFDTADISDRCDFARQCAPQGTGGIARNPG